MFSFILELFAWFFGGLTVLSVVGFVVYSAYLGRELAWDSVKYIWGKWKGRQISSAKDRIRKRLNRVLMILLAPAVLLMTGNCLASPGTATEVKNTVNKLGTPIPEYDLRMRVMVNSNPNPAGTPTWVPWDGGGSQYSAPTVTPTPTYTWNATTTPTQPPTATPTATNTPIFMLNGMAVTYLDHYVTPNPGTNNYITVGGQYNRAAAVAHVRGVGAACTITCRSIIENGYPFAGPTLFTKAGDSMDEGGTTVSNIPIAGFNTVVGASATPAATASIRVRYYLWSE